MPTEISGATGVNKVQTGAIETGDMPTGSVLQVRQTTGTTTISTTSFTSTNTWTDHYSLSITPSSTSSKILILSTNPVGITGSTPMRGALRLLRDTTNIYNTLDWKEMFHVRSASDEVDMFLTFQYLDSPATTSSITYKIQGVMQTGTSMRMQQSGRGTEMTLLEIAG